MTKEELLNLIDSKVYTNGQQKITGGGLNDLLKEMVNSLAGCNCEIVSSKTFSDNISEEYVTVAEGALLLGVSEDDFMKLFRGESNFFGLPVAGKGVSVFFLEKKFFNYDPQTLERTNSYYSVNTGAWNFILEIGVSGDNTYFVYLSGFGEA